MAKGSFCNVCTACAVFLISIAGIVLLALLMKSNGKEKVLIESLSNNLQAKGILEIGRVNSTNCPSGTFPLFQNIFPGTAQNCLCKNNSNGRFSFQGTNKNRCNVNPYYYSCQRMTLPEKTLEVYRGARLCYKPTQFSYDSYEFSTTSAGCPSGSRACGKDEKGYLCLNNTYPCPVNFLKIVQGNSQALTGLVPGEKIISMNQNYHLVYSNQNIEGKIVAETGWSFEAMCADPNQKLISDDSGLKLFLGSNNWVEECDSVEGVTEDKRWRNIDTYNWMLLLGENASAFKNMESSNLLDPADLNKPYKVYHRGYVHFNKKCKWNKNASTHQNLNEISQSKSSAPVSLSGMLIGALVMFCLALVGSMCYFCVSLSDDSESGSLGCCACLWVVLLVAACLIGSTFYYSRDTINIHRESASFTENCMDSMTARQMTSVKSNKANALYFIAISLVLALLGMFLLCCALCCLKCGGRSSSSSGKEYELHENSHGGNYGGSHGKGGKIKHHSVSSKSSDDEPHHHHNNYGGNFYDNPGFNNNPGFYGNNNNNQNGPFFNGNDQNQNQPVPSGGDFFNGGNNPVFGNNNNNDINNDINNDFNNNNNFGGNNQGGFIDFGNGGNNQGGFNDFGNGGNNQGGFNDFGNGGTTFTDFGNNNGNQGGDGGFFDGGRN